MTYTQPALIGWNTLFMRRTEMGKFDKNKLAELDLSDLDTEEYDNTIEDQGEEDAD